MKDILVHMLSEGIAGDLKENPIAYKLLDLVLEGVSQKDFEERLKGTISTTEIKDVDRERVVTNSVAFRDLRIKDISLRGVRAFPLPKDNKWYYWDFMMGGVPASCVFLGNNGVGKTSLFCALEATATGSSSVAKERGYDTPANCTEKNNLKTLQSFLTYYDTDVSKVKARQRFKEGVATLENGNYNGTEVTPAFFCSHWDIMQLSDEERLNEYLLEQLGIRELQNILEYFATLKSGYDTSIQVYKSRCEELAKVKSKLLNDSSTLNTKKQLEEKEQLEEKKQLEVKEQLEVDIKDYKTKYPLLAVSQQQYKFFMEVFDCLRKRFLDILKTFAERLEKIVGEILKPYFYKEIKEIKVKTNVNTLNFSIEIHTRDINHNLVQPKPENQGKKDEWSVAPQKFLNTFRFKLFCVGLKVALAEVVSEWYSVNYPMVIDDVFDSSDFDNRLNIYGFIFDLLTAVKNIRSERLREEKEVNLQDDNIGFQLIFFTQDEIIGDSVYKALRDFEGKDNVKYGRLFHWRECTEKDLVGTDLIKVYDSLV